MLIEYKANGSRRNVRDSVGRVLIARKLATGVYETREMTPEELPSGTLAPDVADSGMTAAPDGTETKEKSKTGPDKPKRQYRRRDMQAPE